MLIYKKINNYTKYLKVFYMTNLKISNKTQLNFIIAGGNSDIINSGAQNTCLYTMNNNTSINTDIVCNRNINTKLDIALLSTGYSPNLNSIYQGNSDTLSIGDNSSGSYNPVLKKLVITIDFYCNPINSPAKRSIFPNINLFLYLVFF